MPDRYAPQLTKSFSRVLQEPTVATENKAGDRQVKWLLLMKLWLLISITSNSMSKSVAVVREALTGIGRAVAISKGHESADCRDDARKTFAPRASSKRAAQIG